MFETELMNEIIYIYIYSILSYYIVINTKSSIANKPMKQSSFLFVLI